MLYMLHKWYKQIDFLMSRCVGFPFSLLYTYGHFSLWYICRSCGEYVMLFVYYRLFLLYTGRFESTFTITLHFHFSISNFQIFKGKLQCVIVVAVQLKHTVYLCTGRGSKENTYMYG